MKTIAVFKSALFKLTWPDDDRNPNYPPAGKPVAEYLKKRLSEIGFETSSPIEGDGYWFLDLAMNGVEFRLSVYWVALDDPPIDWWVVEPEKRLGIIKSVFGSQTESNDLAPISEVLHRVFDNDPQIADLHWLDQQELRDRW